jgi:hypothetical protein
MEKSDVWKGKEYQKICGIGGSRKSKKRFSSCFVREQSTGETLETDTSIPSLRVIRAQERLKEYRDLFKIIRIDNLSLSGESLIHGANIK